jgi:hypothetical protein
MKPQNLKYLRAASMALGLAFVSSPLVPGLVAQTRTQPPPAQQPAQQQEQQKTEVFVGKIVKAENGQFALLIDEQNGRGAYVDDQQKASKFEGKNVKITGVLLATHVIRVTDIELA